MSSSKRFEIIPPHGVEDGFTAFIFFPKNEKDAAGGGGV